MHSILHHYTTCTYLKGRTGRLHVTCSLCSIRNVMVCSCPDIMCLKVSRAFWNMSFRCLVWISRSEIPSFGDMRFMDWPLLSSYGIRGSSGYPIIYQEPRLEPSRGFLGIHPFWAPSQQGVRGMLLVKGSSAMYLFSPVLYRSCNNHIKG